MKVLLKIQSNTFEGYEDVQSFRLYKEVLGSPEESDFGVLQIWRKKGGATAEEFWFKMEDYAVNVESIMKWVEGDALVFHVENYLS